MIYPVILSGGSGTRLWPVSRALYPKQLLPMLSERTMLQETALRFPEGAGYGPPSVICNAEHRFAVAEQMQGIGAKPSAILLEPAGRNSAPAAAVAALHVASVDPEGLVLLLASDHRIERPDAFRAAVETGAVAARAGRLVTFGITPDRPETGYGYIHRNGPLDGMDGCYGIERFVEKPDLATAEKYLAAGDYFWNSGTFLFRARDFLAELGRLAPEILDAARAALDKGVSDLDFRRLDADAFGKAPSISIDYAVMEKTALGAMVPLDAGWSDVGSWSALWAVQEKDAEGNAVQGDVWLHKSRNNLVRAESRLVTVIGAEDLVVIESPDAVLVAAMGADQDVKLAVEALKEAGRPEAISHATTHRPWGSYRNIDSGDGYQVKRITVSPGGRLSLQSHKHRAEHWTVISGKARITRGPSMERLDVMHLDADQSVDIPLGWIHRLENPGTEPLIIVEVQSGSYLGEDDIERFDDQYGR
ncbi:MAG: mannose-1-phosphate guanylyltransferase/mannose-6-phosphate isomerase [Nisaea sp.]|uniref:mannose-1-phosphate guanylyltransferase/mannose-6-phosphate isomerase n=1 Tax=Nisaea sp. TaxID=2024842 RepID=UPI001AFD50D9|nr:mannose-1-phosphate guanylyltransferase/mannose-6-phosphate isomerase [Nisaea sp.]MBO6559581.1 mannose-1-phosphate guanylyltransferase/mannose-6-phosphate isomerase [Nisaea sp.]